MKAAIIQNYLTTIFGILSGLPLLVTQALAGSGVVISPTITHWLLVLSAVGLIGLGLVSKAFNTHSTTAQAAASEAAVVGNPQAPAMKMAADKQVEQGK